MLSLLCASVTNLPLGQVPGAEERFGGERVFLRVPGGAPAGGGGQAALLTAAVQLPLLPAEGGRRVRMAHGDGREGG